MKTRCSIAVMIAILSLCGTLFALADELPVYSGAAAIARDNAENATYYSFSLLKDTKREDVWAFYQQSLKLSDGWESTVAIDSPWLFLRTYTNAKDSHTFGIALYPERMLLLDIHGGPMYTLASDWVRRTMELTAPPAAMVDSESISYQEYYDRMERMPYTDPGSNQQMETGSSVIQHLIAEHLMLKLARTEGVSPTDQQLDDRLNQMVKQSGGATVEDLAKRSGMSTQQLKDLMRVEQSAYNLQTKGVTVTPEDIRKYYNDNKDSQFSVAEQALLAGIFVDSKADADKAMAQLKSGAEFGSVARAMSKHPSASVGGKLAPLSRGDKNIPELVQTAVFKTPQGKYTQPISTGGGGYAIFKVLQHIPKKAMNIDDVKDTITERLKLEKGIQKNGDLGERLGNLHKSSVINVGIDRYRAAATQAPAK